MRGTLIAVEGIDGAGKSTFARALGNTLEGRGLPVVQTAEPWLAPLQGLLRSPTSLRSQWARLELFAADRAEHVTCVIKPALEQGRVVICDRYVESTIAYQSELAWPELPSWWQQEQIAKVRSRLGGPAPLDDALAALWMRPDDVVSSIATRAALECEPDWTILVDAPTELALERIQQRHHGPDWIEQLGGPFLDRCRARYLASMASDAGDGVTWLMVNGATDDIDGQVQQVVAEMEAAGTLLRIVS